MRSRIVHDATALLYFTCETYWIVSEFIAETKLKDPRFFLNVLRGNVTHAKNKIARGFITFLELDFWDINTGICTGAMPYRRDFTATTRIKAF